jgi:hypothetical protein
LSYFAIAGYNIYMQKTITKFLILTITLTLALSVNYIFAAWVGPTQAPPGGNTPTPIHVGSTNQVKDGGLSVNALSVFGNEYVQGTIQVGNSGITPQAGTIRWTGSDFEGYDGTQWVSLVGSAAVAPAADPNYTDCINAGGNWVDAQGVCYFNGTSCPSGWSKKENYSSTSGSWCGGRQANYDPGCGAGTYCSTGSHTRTNTSIESCSGIVEYGRTNDENYQYCWGETCIATASVTEIGCTKN